ncbi:MAG: hypothetical protein R2752_21265 [Vicinamibacterales bacterium]
MSTISRASSLPCRRAREKASIRLVERAPVQQAGQRIPARQVRERLFAFVDRAIVRLNSSAIRISSRGTRALDAMGPFAGREPLGALDEPIDIGRGSAR